jgi:HPt (histidine-containing phosphotransfer) domain-containing protein
VRKIVERWGSVATMPEAAVAQTATATHSTEHMHKPEKESNEPPPVNMERLLDFTNGNPEDLRELISLYLRQTTEQVAQIAAAVQANAPAEVRRLAHSCAGASATCGMTRIVPFLRELERQGNEEKLTGAAELSRQVTEEFKVIRNYLETYMQKHAAMAAQH